MNIQLATQVIETLLKAGVKCFCICPGGMAGPFIALFEQLKHVKTIEQFFFFNEQSAAFFAMGRIKQTQEPAAVITTCGTAAAQPLPAVMEAYYTRLPLVLVTGDRPRLYRGTGAPQIVHQPKIFGRYAPTCIDLEGDQILDLKGWEADSPLHINVCFGNPVIDSDPGIASKKIFQTASLLAQSVVKRGVSQRKDISGEQAELREFIESHPNLLVIVGGLSRKSAGPVAKFLEKLRAPVVLEPYSQLREEPSLAGICLPLSDFVTQVYQECDLAYDGVLRIGGVPAAWFWPGLTQLASSGSVLTVSDYPFSGIPSGRLLHAPLETFFSTFSFETKVNKAQTDKLIGGIQRYVKKVDALLKSFPTSEPGLLSRLSKLIPEHSRIYLGNGMSIREWGIAATLENRFFDIEANRGANGIDGQLSTFFGFAQKGIGNWSITGDLTFLYDITAPWILKQLSHDDCQLVVINNKGGRLFRRTFPDYPDFINQHDIKLENVASLWDLEYQYVDNSPFEIHHSANSLIELCPDLRETELFWKEFDELKSS